MSQLRCFNPSSRSHVATGMSPARSINSACSASVTGTGSRWRRSPASGLRPAPLREPPRLAIGVLVGDLARLCVGSPECPGRFERRDSEVSAEHPRPTDISVVSEELRAVVLGCLGHVDKIYTKSRGVNGCARRLTLRWEEVKARGVGAGQEGAGE